MITTVVLAVKATPKAMKSIEEAKEEKGEELTKFETVKAAAPAYVPSVVSGAATMACIFGANVLNKRKQASLASAYMLVGSAYRDYKNKVKETIGEEAEQAIQDAIIKDKYANSEVEAFGDTVLFGDDYYGTCFALTMEDMLRATYHFNRNFVLRGYASLNEFYAFLDLPPIEGGDSLGWNSYLGETYYGYTWVDFNFRRITLDDGLECYMIEYPFPPTQDYMNEWD
jgi:hypothetical protein